MLFTAQSSEHDAPSQLHLPRCGLFPCNVAEGAGGGVSNIRGREVGMVESVKRLETKLQVGFFREVEVLQHRGVEVIVPVRSHGPYRKRHRPIVARKLPVKEYRAIT